MEYRGLGSLGKATRANVEKVVTIFEGEYKDLSNSIMVRFGQRNLQEVLKDNNIAIQKASVCIPDYREDGSMHYEIYLNMVAASMDAPFYLAHELGHVIAVQKMCDYESVDFLADKNLGYNHVIGTTAVQELHANIYAYTVLNKISRTYCKDEFKRMLEDVKEFAVELNDNGNIAATIEDLISNSELIGLAVVLDKVSKIRELFSKLEAQLMKLIEVSVDLQKFNLEAVREIMRGE